jgi:hypothetical protein
MNRIALTLIGVAALALGACDDSSDSLTNGSRENPRPEGATAGGENTTFDHSNDPNGAAPGADIQPPEPAQMKLVGSPEVVARLHSCGKLSYASIGSILSSRGMTTTGTPTGAPSGTQSASTIYKASSAQLGAANYTGRVPEAPFASTSSLAKMFDIFTMGSYEVSNTTWTSTACPGVKVVGADGKFTKDGLSCLMGKPATQSHVDIANDAIAKNPTDGAKIAIAAVLSAAQTCQ